MESQSKLSGVFSKKGANPIMKIYLIWNYLHLIISQIPNPITLEVRASTYEWGGGLFSPWQVFYSSVYPQHSTQFLRADLLVGTDFMRYLMVLGVLTSLLYCCWWGKSTQEAAWLGSDPLHLAPLQTLPKNPWQGAYERKGKEMCHWKAEAPREGNQQSLDKARGEI